MSRSLNRVQLIGNLGKDSETKYTQSGTPYTRFSVATERNWKDKSSGEWKAETDWHSVTLWNRETLAQYLTRGQKVYVEGRLQPRSYEDKDGVKRYSIDIIAEDVILLGGKGNGSNHDSSGEFNQERQPVSQPRRQSQGEYSPPEFVGDDDVPF